VAVEAFTIVPRHVLGGGVDSFLRTP